MRRAWLLVALTLFLSIVLTSRRAVADTVPVRIAFDVPFEERPNVLCIVSKLQGGDSAKLSAFGKRRPAGTGQEKGRAKKWEFALPEDWAKDPVPANANPAPPSKSLPLVRDTIISLIKRSTQEEPKEACEAAACAPDLDPPNDDERLSVSCKRNDQDDGGTRTLFLHLNFHRDDKERTPTIGVPYLAGTAASVKMTLDKPRTFVSAQVIGGDYLPGNAIIFTQDADRNESGTVRLEPRCRKHDLVLNPRPDAGTVRIFVRLPTEQESTACADGRVGQGGRLSLFLPYGQEGDVKSVIVEAGEFVKGGFARFVASWTAKRPPPSLDLRPTALSFRWKRHPLYGATTKCPLVRLAASPTTGCHEVAAPESADDALSYCRYTCGKEKEDPGDPELAIPAEVVFTSEEIPRADPHARSSVEDRDCFRLEQSDDGAVPVLALPPETWRGTVDHVVSSSIEAYVPPAERSIAVDFADVTTTAVGSRVREVQLRTVDGTVRRVSVRHPRLRIVTLRLDNGRPVTLRVRDSCQRVLVPNLDREDVVAYRFVGERSFDEGAIMVKDRSIRLPNPAQSSRNWAVSASLAGGALFPVGDRRPSAGGYFPTTPAGSMSVALSYRPWGTRLGIEIHARYTLTGQSYFPASPVPNRDAETVLYHRLGGDLAVPILVSSNLVLAPIAGLYAAFPTLRSELDLVGSERASMAIGGLVRGLLTTSLWLEIDVRLFVRERYNVFTTTQSGRGGDNAFVDPPTVSTGVSLAPSIMGGFRYDVPFSVARAAVLRGQ